MNLVRLLLTATVLPGLLACDPVSPEATWLASRPAPPLEGLAVGSERHFRLEDQRGKVVLLGFGYTSCLAICPLTLATMNGVYRALGAEAGSLQAVYVSVDPDRDRPPAFRDFLRNFDPRIVGLAVSSVALPDILRGYHAVAVKGAPEVKRYLGPPGYDPAGDYSIAHTASLWLIDPAGRLRVRYSPRARSTDIALGVDRLLHGGA